MNRRQVTRNQRGDTIVEVMISVAILSMALGIAYSLTGRSLKEGITSRERNQALNIVQGQIEQLKARRNASDSSAAAFDAGTGTYAIYKDISKNYCFNGDPANTAAPVTNPAPGTPAASNYNAACYVGPDGTTSVGNQLYYLNIHYNGTAYVISADWVGLNTPINQLTMYYKL